MLQKSLHKDQMTFPVVTASLTSAPAPTILQLDSLRMFLQEASSAYPADITAYN